MNDVMQGSCSGVMGSAVTPAPPAMDGGLYDSSAAEWFIARAVSTLTPYADGQQSTSQSTGVFGISVRVADLSVGQDYRIEFEVEHDTGTGYSHLRFDSTSNLYGGTFDDFASPEVQTNDVVLTATHTTMYLGALRLNHNAVGSFIRFKDIRITEA